MKTRFLAVLAGLIASLACLAGSAAAQGGQLVSAEFGYGDHRADVTQQVRQYMHDGVLRFQVTKEALGADPARGHVKELFIRVRHWDGNTEEFRYPEYAQVNLEMDPDAGYNNRDREGGDRRDGDRPGADRPNYDRGGPDGDNRDRGLRIMRAYYGGEGNFVNVTDQVRSLARDGHVEVRVDNNSMGGDPDHAIHKVLRVLYFSNGERHQIVVPEHEVLRLP